MSDRKWASLHGHTSFSLMDGIGMPKDHMERLSDLSIPGAAITEHGNVSSHVQWEKAAKKHGIKPMFGMEAYCATGPEDGRFKHHLTILAADQDGYANLNRLTTEAWRDFYYEPTVTAANFHAYQAGLIVLSGCSGSRLACDLLGGKGIPEHDPDIETATATALRFKAILGDRYYLEVQPFHTLERTRLINSSYEEISNKTGIPLVATGDVHYAKPDQNDLQVILHATGRGSNTFEKQQQSWGYDVRLTYAEEDKAIFSSLLKTGLSRRAAGAAMLNTLEIMDRCNIILPRAELFEYPTDDPTALIWAWLREGWKTRIKQSQFMRDRKDEYTRKIQDEMALIIDKGFQSYFLMLADVVRWAKQQGILVGPARGSAGSSVVCWVLGISEVEPPRFPLMAFERFIDETRTDLPDIDLDFDDARRDEIRKYLQDKYGFDCVGNIGNFVKYRGKNALDDVGRVYRDKVPKHEVEVIKKLVVNRTGGDSRLESSLEDTIEMFPAAKAVYERHPELAQALRLEGMMKSMSIHAAGLVVSTSPLNEVVATYEREDGKGRILDIIAVDRDDCAYLNLMKADFLGLQTLGILQDVLTWVGKDPNWLYALPLDDAATMRIFTEVDVVGVFQFSGRATRLVTKDVEPTEFRHLIDINCMSRPGPLFSGATAAYCDVKHGRKEITSLHPAIDAIIAPTNGQVLYQEQILFICREIGDMPWKIAHDIRRIISKKMGEAAFNNYWDMFRDGAAKKHGIPEDAARYIWNFMATSGTYTFVYAHSVAYTIIGYWCAYLKAHYPAEFYAACLRREVNDPEGTRRLIKDAEVHGIRVLGPSLKSKQTWEAHDGEVRAGFLQIPGIGPKTADAIVKYGEVDEWQDLGAIRGIGQKTIEIIEEFAQSEDPFGLLRVRRIIEANKQQIEEGELPLPMPTHMSDDLPDASGPVVWMGFVKLKEYKDLIEDQRARTGEDVQDILKRTKHPDKLTSCTLHCYDHGGEDVYLRFDRVRAFPQFRRALEAITPHQDLIVVTGSRKQGFGSGVQVRNLWVIDVSEDE